MTWVVIIFRFLLTFFLALAFGIERQKSNKPIGFGTFIFVAIGSCGLAIIATTLGSQNPLPLLSAIVTGIGFLGAGALIRTTDKIFGFTTAASIWVFAIFGMVVGTGEYIIGIIIYILIWMTVAIDRYLEKWSIGSYRKKVIVNTNKLINEKEITKILLMNTKSCKIISTEIDKKNNRLVVTYLIEGTKEEINKIPRQLLEKEWFDSCRSE